MKRLALAFLIASGMGAAAQPASDIPEQVIVTAPRLDFAVTPDAVAHYFVHAYAVPSVMLNEIPRWHKAVCPEIRGLPPNFAAVVSEHLTSIETAVGAPLPPAGCKPNLSITFTDKPQVLLDAIHAKNQSALGYHGATTITHPVQAWYETGYTDMDNKTYVDEDDMGSLDTRGAPYLAPSSVGKGGGYANGVTWTNPTSHVRGLRDHPDLSSDFLGVFVIVDTKQTGDLSVGAMADYVAMLALSQTKAYETCQIIPSIANLLSPCDPKLKPAAITASDIAFLRGVYKMDADASLTVQQDQIAGEMAASLTGVGAP